MKKAIIVMTGIFTMAAVPPAMAGSSSHNMGNVQHEKPSMQEMFLVKKKIDGFTVSFHVMLAQNGMQHGGTHNLMVKVEQAGKTLAGLTANSKVKHPNGTTESKLLMAMGDWYMAGYDLGHAGRHQLMVLFKTTDGAKHFGGVFYPDDGQGGH